MLDRAHGDVDMLLWYSCASELAIAHSNSCFASFEFFYVSHEHDRAHHDQQCQHVRQYIVGHGYRCNTIQVHCSILTLNGDHVHDHEHHKDGHDVRIPEPHQARLGIGCGQLSDEFLIRLTLRLRGHRVVIAETACTVRIDHASPIRTHNASHDGVHF